AIANQRFNDGSNSTALDDLYGYQDRLASIRRQRNGKSGPTTGFPELDQALGGGLKGLSFLGGPAMSGKSALAMHVMLNSLAADDKLAVLVISLDMDRSDWFDRLICHTARIDHRSFNRWPHPPDVKQRVKIAIKQLKANKLGRIAFIDQRTLGHRTIEEVLPET